MKLALIDKVIIDNNSALGKRVFGPDLIEI